MLFRFLLLSLLTTLTIYANSSFGTIATGSQNGTYLKIGTDLATVFEKYKAKLKILTSEGSTDNLDLLTGKKQYKNVKWAIVQNDALSYYDFTHFKDTREELKNKVKTILPLYSEHIHILKKKGSKHSFKKGSVLRVGISSKASGSNITANLIENIYKVNFKYSYLDTKKALQQLQEGKLDIIIDVISFPSKKFKNLKNVELVQLPNNKKMNKKYLKTQFTKSTYPWLTKDISGYKVPSVIVTDRVEKKYNQTVGIFLKIILNNYQALTKYGHPKWKEAYKNRTLKLKNMHPVAFRILQR